MGANEYDRIMKENIEPVLLPFAQKLLGLQGAKYTTIKDDLHVTIERKPDFLKKVKQAHAALTPNDLRLCAYLRLNLSSKEIAPLLNISVRSVEIKRYRLRKKMDLSHEQGLVEYILSI